MSDEVDDLLRHAMANLDRQVPAGTFDTLADRTLARLDAANVPNGDDLARERALRGGGVPAAAMEPAPTADRLAVGPEPRRRKVSVLAAVVGVGLAAAAAVVIVVSLRSRPTGAPAVAMDRSRGGAVASEPPRAAAPPPAPASSPLVAPEMTKPTSTASGGGKLDSERAHNVLHAAPPPSGAQAAKPEALRTGKARPTSAQEPTAQDIDVRDTPGQDATARDARKKAKTKSDKPAIASASLSQDDFARGMTAVAVQVRACGGGTRGSAVLQVSVSPSGRVATAKVSGVFAGTPVAACVERAVASATFPPWNGAPQTLGYSYLLAD